jgi:cephalosporin hydroxylase
MGILVERFNNYQSADGRLFNKHPKYAPIYEKYLEPFRNKPITFVEVGVGKGGNMMVWKEFLGPQAKIWGIDFLDRLVIDDPQMQFMIGNQGDRNFLGEVRKKIGKIDVLIDDASHVVSDQIATFEELFPIIAPGGLYICEDTHTSYREKHYDGGYLKEGTFIEYCKKIIDEMYCREDPKIPTNEVTVDKVYELSFFLTLIIMRKEGEWHA